MTISVGDHASRTKTFTDEIVRGFAALSDDTNPIHLDDDYAASTRFSRRLVHGVLTASLISATIANDLPGEGSVYISQTLNFKAPVFVGDTVTATVEVTDIERSRATLRTICANQAGELVIEGEAQVLLPRPKGS